MSFYYKNKLGQYQDISLNHVANFKKNNLTIKKMEEDSNKLLKSYNLQLAVWSITAGISILTILMIIKKLRN
jgi:hypothetical protein